MSDIEVRKAITEYTRENIDTDVSDVVNAVAETMDVPTGVVRDELDALEKNGFVYIVNDEVKVA